MSDYTSCLLLIDKANTSVSGGRRETHFLLIFFKKKVDRDGQHFGTASLVGASIFGRTTPVCCSNRQYLFISKKEREVRKHREVQGQSNARTLGTFG
jgi:hypothetical protein